MIENSNSLTSNRLQIFAKRFGIANDLEKLLTLKSNEQRKLSSIASNELIDIHIRKKMKKEMKNPCEKTQKKNFESLYYKKREIKTGLGFLVVTSKKKQIIERSPEQEKKPKPKIIFNTMTQSKTYYTPKTTLMLTSDNSSPQVVTVKPTGNPYENWKVSNNYSMDAKIFIIAGNYPDIRKSLIQRGWIENTDTESIFFDLKWSRNARVPSNILDWQLYNHFPRNFELSIKWELYENIKRSNSVTNTCYTKFFPRSFRLNSKGTSEFLENYKSIYALSVLKNYKDYSSKYYYEQIVIANIIAKRWATENEKQNCSTERKSPLVMNVEWRILSSSSLAEIQSIFSRLMLPPISDIYEYTCSNLAYLEQVDPQHRINGRKNIWIIKAGRKSRGRDIFLLDDIETLKSYTANSKFWVIQKYIENPMILCGKKFDIRQWVLISNSDPLTIWIYKRCYLRFSIEDYSDENIENPYIHLTNNSISKTSKKYNASDIQGCMWSIDQFKEYLIDEKGSDLWTLLIYPSLKKIVKNSLLAVGNLGRKNSFEILGYDFMIDDTCKPWLLEINSSPAMDYSTVIFKQNVTEVLVKDVLEDAVKVIVDCNSAVCDTGNFELCFKSNSYCSMRKNN